MYKKKNFTCICSSAIVHVYPSRLSCNSLPLNPLKIRKQKGKKNVLLTSGMEERNPMHRPSDLSCDIRALSIPYHVFIASSSSFTGLAVTLLYFSQSLIPLPPSQITLAIFILLLSLPFNSGVGGNVKIGQDFYYI